MSDLPKLLIADQHFLIRHLLRNDLFFLLTIGLSRADIAHPWLLARCKEVQASPNGHLDLWARDHRKSSIITYALSIQDILSSHGNDPDPKWRGVEIAIGIFSVTRPLAKQFLAQIKREFEANLVLREYFPDILWENPDKEAPSWSLDNGIFVKRRANKKEATVEAWGLVDGQPTSKHFDLMVYDDVVTHDHVRSPAAIEKTTQAWEMSLSLGTADCIYRYIGTRYHYNDTYKVIMERESAIPRLHPATVDGTMEGEPVLLTKETLVKKRRDMGPYTFSCFPANSPILMADFTEKPIEQIQEGEEVIGYTIGKGKGAKGSLVKTKVKAVGGRFAEVFEYTFESGRIVQCTADHKWFTGRSASDHHRVYNKLGFGHLDNKGLISVYDPRRFVGHDPIKASWLSGLYDGEGSYSSNTITITQSPEHNPEVFARIEDHLKELGFDYGQHFKEAGTSASRNNKRGCIFYLRGGRQTAIRFLNIIKPAKAKKIVDAILKQTRGQNGDGKNNKDKLISIKSLGQMPVYNIETETGNYVSWGYYTKNSQMLLNPTADSNQGFKTEWLVYHNVADFENMNRYIIVDPANEKKKDNDYTVMMVIGLAADSNFYILSMLRDRLSLTERAAALFRLHRKYKPKAVGYEQYGMQADIAHIKDKMRLDNYNFKIIELGGNLAKVDRIKGLIPLFEQNRIYLPDTCYKTNYEKKTEDLTEVFITHEYQSFPVAQHDDMLDALARINDEDLKIIWPKLDESDEDYTDYNRGSAWGA